MSWAEPDSLRACAYGVVAILCFVAARREDRDAPGSWPPFWILTGVLFVTIALGRAGHITDLMTEAVRRRALSEGWYERRGHVQARVVGILALTWLLCVLVSLWRISARRLRYVPMVVVVLTIGFYTLLRIVSLHQVDSVLYRHHTVGLQDGTLIEFALLAVGGVCAIWTPHRKASTAPRPAPVTASK